MKNNRTVLLIGGHITPLIATYVALVSKQPDYRYIVAGRKYALEGSRVISEEYHLVQSLGIPFLSLITGRFTRALGLRAIVSIIKLPVGFVQSIYFCLTYKPDVIVSFGGYLSLPIVVAGWLLGIPSVTHEQTSSMGLTNRILRFFVRKVLLSYENTRYASEDTKTIVTGLPIRKEIFHPPDKPSFPLSSGYPIIYITGGSTGSTSINSVVFDVVPILTRQFVVVHQTGRLDYEKGLSIHKELPESVSNRYIVTPYFDVSDISWLLHKCTMVVGRSGANTVAEVDASGAIALFIPLPWAGSGEQMQNAQSLVDKGVARILVQSQLSKETLINEIQYIHTHVKEMKSQANKNKSDYSMDPSTRIATEVISLMT